MATKQRALTVHLPPTRASDDNKRPHRCCRSKPYVFVPTTYGAVATTKVTFKEGTFDAAIEFLMSLDLTSWAGLVRMRLIKLVSPRSALARACNLFFFLAVTVSFGLPRQTLQCPLGGPPPRTPLSGLSPFIVQ